MSADPGHIPKLGHLVVSEESGRIDLDYFLRNPYDDIALASVELPAIIEHINAELQYVNYTRTVKKQEIKSARARAYIRLKNGEARTFTHEKPTDKTLEYLVDMDEEVNEAVEAYAIFLSWAVRLNTTIGVLQAKLDMVRSTESTRRKLIPDGDDDNDNDTGFSDT